MAAFYFIWIIWIQLKGKRYPIQICGRIGFQSPDPLHRWCTPEVAGVTFSDCDSAPVPKFLNPCPDPVIFQIWESDSCSDSGYSHQSKRNSLVFLLKKWPHRFLPLPKWKSDSGSGSGFSKIFDSGSGPERKTHNPSGVDSRTPQSVPPLVYQRWSDSGFLLSDLILFLKNDIRIRSESCFGWNHTIRIRKLSEGVLRCITYIFCAVTYLPQLLELFCL